MVYCLFYQFLSMDVKKFDLMLIFSIEELRSFLLNPLTRDLIRQLIQLYNYINSTYKRELHFFDIFHYLFIILPVKRWCSSC
jgi:hypothetical protein